MESVRRPWAAVITMLIGFFMILIDSTIVSVANPSITKGLNTDINSTVWVTSAYLLTFAVPLLLAGRLGDRFGPKNVFLAGMFIFTAASLACGLSDSIGTLIAARAVQGLGASLMSPQTMAVITRIFPAEKRGGPMGLWGATSGVALLVGPILGGFLVDAFGWESIFIINVPIGIIGIVLVWIFVPKLPTSSHSFDLLGVFLSGVGLFLIVFGIQEGESHDWGKVWGPITVWQIIGAGIIVMAGFIFWQSKNKREPLLPLKLFRDHDFSIANTTITAVGFAITTMPLPLMYFYQSVRGMTPTQSALTMIPMAVIGGVLSPFVGAKIVPRFGSRRIAVVGMILLALSIFWYSRVLSPDNSVGWVLLPSALLGIASSCIWGPLALAATHHLPPALAGAGAGVYNVTRQIGAVLGSACIVALMGSRLSAELPAAAEGAGPGSGTLPDFLHQGFTDAMSQSLLLPAGIALVGAVAAFFLSEGKSSDRTMPASHTAAEKVAEVA